MTKIEEVARAIKAKVPIGYGMTDDEAMVYARAAIEAMRSPNLAMVIAGENFIGRYAYSAMIDAALSEGEERG